MFSRRLTEATAIGLVTAVLVYLVSLTPFFHRIENQYGLGILYSLRGPIEPPDGAVVIAIDRETIVWLREQADVGVNDRPPALACLSAGVEDKLTNIRGPGSLPRSVHGCLINQLNDAGIPVIVFDILFSVEGTEEDDRAFTDAIRDHGGTLILAGIERSTIRDQASELLVERRVIPVDSFAEFAAASGTFIVPRSVGPVYGYWREIAGFGDVPSLPDEAYRIYRSLRSSDGNSEAGTATFRYLWVYGAPGSVPTISASRILDGQIPENLKSKATTTVAFVGASDPTMTNYPDSFPSYFRATSRAGISGVELAATAFLNLSTGDILRPLSTFGAALTTIVFVFILGFTTRVWTRYALFIVPVAAIAYVAGASLVFSKYQVILPISGSVFVAAPLVFTMAVFFKYTAARALLMRLAPAPVARRMLRRETERRSSAVADDVTVIFFDLIGSTGIAENLSPIEFSKLLNGYYDTVTNSVEQNRGQIVSFSGDGVMAVFSRLDAGTDHAAHACNAALDAVWNLRAYNLDNQKLGLPPLQMRIGMNSGGVAEGEIGAVDRFNFSVVGDVVNLAARLEQLGKIIFPGQPDVILLGIRTKDLAQSETFKFVDCGLHKISGREREEQVFLLSVD